MKKIIYISGSSSSRSINRKFAKYTAGLLSHYPSKELNLNDFEVPIFSIDREEESGIPDKIEDFLREIEEADGLIISLAEHNGTYTVAMKNIIDWSSRADRSVWKDKPMLLLSTSPGRRGAASVFDFAIKHFPHMGGNIVASFKLPSFYENFNSEVGITDEKLNRDFQNEVQKFERVLGSNE